MNFTLPFDAMQALLEDAYRRYHRPDFVADDPISIPHRFSRKQDIEIAAFFTATLAWGKRSSIINSAQNLMTLMDNAPADFILHHRDSDLKMLQTFVHRTFNGDDLLAFVAALKRIYLKHGGLEQSLTRQLQQEGNMMDALAAFHRLFFEGEHLARSRKHLSNPQKGSAAKRLNMFLRWMVRPDDRGIDFGLWADISPALLMMPLDVHTARVGRRLGLLQRKSNDRKAVEELSSSLALFDPRDPVRFDFALFGMGVYKEVR